MAVIAHEKTRVQLCGQMSVEIEGVEVAQALRGRQVRLLLAYLLLNRTRAMGREELIGALWPSQAPISEDGSLRTLLSRLRSAIGSKALHGREELSLSFPEPVWVDFEAARAELSRAQTALEHDDARTAWGIAQVPLNIASRGLLPGAQADWLEPPRRELEDIRLHALEVIGGAGLRLGGAQLGSVERAARALIEAEPYRESGYTLLMQSQAIRGNAAEGLRVFDRLRTLLREELGTAPSADAIATHDQLLRRASSSSGQRRPHRGAYVELPAELRARAQAVLIGRDEELAALGRLWSLARADPAPAGPTASARAAGVVVLAGDAGIGKTSLAAELARRAHEDGAVVLAGRAPEEGLAPYQPFLEALSHYFATADLDDIRGALREHGPELSRLLPELRHRAPDLPAPPGDPEGERYRLFESVVGLLSSIAEHAPILIVLDDLQWADRPTLWLLRHLARSPRRARLLVLLAFRTEAATDVLGDFLAEMGRDGLSTQLDIGGLGERDTTELVRARAGERPSSAFARRIHRETEGNPFFVEEIVRNLVAAGMRVGAATASELQRLELPEGVKRMIARRLDRLHPRTIEWLRVASVAGRDFDAELLEQLLDLDEEEFLTALEEALAAGVLLESTAFPGRYSFSHALIREALYESMSAPRRARLHRRVGEALEATGQQPLSSLALHFTRAGSRDAEKAISYAVQAAQEATNLLAHEEALDHYARALEVLTRYHPADSERRLELLLGLGDACVRSGERPRARRVLLEAAALAEELDDTPSLVRAAVGAARRYVQQPGVVDIELIHVLDRALEKTDGERTVDRVRLLARMCGTLYYTDQHHRIAGLSLQATEIARGLQDPEATALACAARRQSLWNPSHLRERLSVSTQMLTAAQQAGQPELQLQAHAWLVTDLLENGDLGAVDAQIAAFAIGADQLRQPLFRWQAMVWRAMRALLDGRLEVAEEAAAEALVIGAPGETVTAPQYHAIQLLNIRREQARAGEVEELIRRMAEANPARLGWRVGLGLLLSDTGRTAEAQAELAFVEATGVRTLPEDGDWLPTMTQLGQLVTLVEDRDQAAGVYESLAPYATANVVRGVGVVCLGPVARVLGRLAWLLGQEQDVRQHFQTALRIAATSRAPALLAHTQLDYAEALGRGPEAARLAQAAATTGRELGLTALSLRAERTWML